MGHFCHLCRVGYAGLLCHLERMDRLHAGHRGFAESYQQIRHSGVFVRWKGAGYMEPEQGEPYRDTL